MEISERHSRLCRSWPLLLLVGLSGLAGCGHAPAESPLAAASDPDGSASTSTTASTARGHPAPSYTALPRDQVETLRATDFDLLRCSFRVDDRWYSLDCEVPGSELSPDARRELEAILPRLLERPVQAPSRRRDGPPLRLYDLNVRERWIFDLEIADAGFERPLTVECVSEVDSPRPHTGAGHLGAELRRHALEALLESGTRPRRAPAWRAFALARLIEPDNRAGDRSAASRELYEQLVADVLDSPDAGRRSRLAALLVPSVDLLTDGRGAVLLGSDVTAARVLPLTRKALGGDRSALYEIFRLAMEYGGDPAVFVAAARRLFPLELNPALVARHPQRRDRDEPLLLLAAVRRSVDRAEHESGRGWRLPVE